MKRVFFIGMIGLVSCFGCDQKAETIPQPQKMEQLPTDEQLNGYLQMYRKILASDEIDFKETDWSLTDIYGSDYRKLRTLVTSIGDTYHSSFKYQKVRDLLAIDIKKIAEKFVEKGVPILLIYGIGSDSLAIRHNRFENEINLKFMGCNGDYLLPTSERINSRFPNIGKNLRLTGNLNYYPNPHLKSLKSIYKNIAFQKFNEATIIALERKYGFKSIDKVLSRNLD